MAKPKSNPKRQPAPATSSSKSASSSPRPPTKRSVLIACGGTGGHLYPGIAVAEVLKQQGHSVILLISEKKIDSLAASGHPDLHFERMPSVAMPRPWSPKMFGFLRTVWTGIRNCRRLIQKHQIDTVLGMGGFTSFAPLYAGKKEQCNTLIHESNAIPGKANRLNARYSSTVLVGLEPCRSHFPKHPNIRTVGTPIRSNMTAEPTEDPYAFFNLNPKLKTLLIMGGSQGARGVNRVVGMTLNEFEAIGIQVLHITGPTDYEEARNVYAKHPMLAQHVAAFCHRMDLAYRVADLAIARAGASSLAELTHFGVPSLLIPYPHAAEDHQTRNAEFFAKSGAARLLPEASLNADILGEEVRRVLQDDQVAQTMKKAALQMATPDAAVRIASLITNAAANG